MVVIHNFHVNYQTYSVVVLHLNVHGFILRFTYLELYNQISCKRLCKNYQT